MSLTFSVPGNLGIDAGPASDGVLIGQVAPADPTKVLLKSQVAAALAYTDDGGLYVDETTPFGEATADDVEVLPATPAVDDAFYVGEATNKFAQIEINETTQGAGTWTIVWEYWNGTAWTALAGVTDGTTGFTAATGWVSVTFTEPTDWETCLVDGVNAYWVRARVSAYTSVTTAPQVGQGYVVNSAASTWTDDTTDFTDAGAGDVDLLPAYPLVGDGIYIGYTEKFFKLKVTTSQARTGTATLALKYWNGTAWATVTTVTDVSVGWSATAGTLFVHFTPPADWVANTAANGPNGEAGFFVAMELTAKTSVTQQPLATQGWVYPVSTGATGIPATTAGSSIVVTMMAQTASGSAANSTFLVVNCSTGVTAEVVWTKADALVKSTVAFAVARGNEIAIVQTTEDGTTEFADANFEVSPTY